MFSSLSEINSNLVCHLEVGVTFKIDITKILLCGRALKGGPLDLGLKSLQEY